MKLEKGKFYRSRDGRKWEVLTMERSSKDYPVIVMRVGHSDFGALTSKGKCIIGGCEYKSDLIAEWTEPVEIPWSDYPTWCKWVAMDADGEWCCYDSKPNASLSTWINEDFVNIIHPDYCPRNFTGDWTESLFERP